MTATLGLSHLNRADGSATYTYAGYTVIASVNGPVEVQRRDELPEEAAIEVNVRPATGIGSPKIRQLELTMHSIMRHVILTHQSPRTLIQITLQILSGPDTTIASDRCRESYASLSVLPALLQAALLALLSGSMPLATTFTAALVGVTRSKELVRSPSYQEVVRSSSLHVFAFSPSKEMLLTESDGNFDLDIWDEVYQDAENVCCSPAQDLADDDDKMVDNGDDPHLHELLHEATKQLVHIDQRWKHNT